MSALLPGSPYLLWPVTVIDMVFCTETKAPVILSHVATSVPLNYHDLYSFPYFLTSQVQTSDIQGGPPRTHPDPSFLSSLPTWLCCIPLCFLLSIHHFPVEMGIPSSNTWNAKCSKSEAFWVPTISRREFYTWLHVTDCSQNSDIIKIVRKIIYIHIYIVNRFGPLWLRYLIMRT